MATFDMLRNDAKRLALLRGDAIFSAGDPGDCADVVTAGEVDLSIHEHHIESVASGQIFGEMALIDHKTRSATATARTDTKIVPVDQRRFLYLVQNTPYFADRSHECDGRAITVDGRSGLTSSGTFVRSQTIMAHNGHVF